MHLLALCPGLAWQRPPTTRRSFVAGGAGVMMGDWRDKLMNPFGAAPAEAAVPRSPGSKGPTNEVVRTVNGIRHKRLGAGDIIVSEVGLGTQRCKLRARRVAHLPDEILRIGICAIDASLCQQDDSIEVVG